MGNICPNMSKVFKPLNGFRTDEFETTFNTAATEGTTLFEWTHQLFPAFGLDATYDDPELIYVYCNSGKPSLTDGVDGSNCQYWDSVNSRCGLQTTDYINKVEGGESAHPSITAYGVLQQLNEFLLRIKTIFGTTAVLSGETDVRDTDGENGNAKLTQIERDIKFNGAVDERDTDADDSNNRVSNIIRDIKLNGAIDERDTDAEDSDAKVSNIIRDIKLNGAIDERDTDADASDDRISNIVRDIKLNGAIDERDIDPENLDERISNIIRDIKLNGAISERDSLDGLLISNIVRDKYLIGTLAERDLVDSTAADSFGLDGYQSFMKLFRAVVGQSSKIRWEDYETGDLLGPIVQTLYHEHDKHLHTFFNDVSATTLAAEFFSKQDLDGGKTPAGATDSIYGSGFMVSEEDPDCPPVLKATHQHEDWEDPALAIDWADYLALTDHSHHHII